MKNGLNTGNEPRNDGKLEWRADEKKLVMEEGKSLEENFSEESEMFGPVMRPIGEQTKLGEMGKEQYCEVGEWVSEPLNVITKDNGGEKKSAQQQNCHNTGKNRNPFSAESHGRVLPPAM